MDINMTLINAISRHSRSVSEHLSDALTDFFFDESAEDLTE